MCAVLLLLLLLSPTIHSHRLSQYSLFVQLILSRFFSCCLLWLQSLLVISFLSILLSSAIHHFFRKDYKIAPQNDIFDGMRSGVCVCVAQVYHRATCEWNVLGSVGGSVSSVRESLLQAVANLSSWHYYLWNWTKATHCLLLFFSLEHSDTMNKRAIERCSSAAKNPLKFMDEKYCTTFFFLRLRMPFEWLLLTFFFIFIDVDYAPFCKITPANRF